MADKSQAMTAEETAMMEDVLRRGDSIPPGYWVDFSKVPPFGKIAPEVLKEHEDAAQAERDRADELGLTGAAPTQVDGTPPAPETTDPAESPLVGLTPITPPAETPGKEPADKEAKKP